MRILLDECLPHKLGSLLIGHEVVPVGKAGWAGIKNGKLLALAQESFDVFLTIDQNLSAQQNLISFHIAVVVLTSKSNKLSRLEPLVPKLLELLSIPVTGLHRIS